MDSTSAILLTDLRHLIADLGKDGGQISPGIYDTAQVLRLAPPGNNLWPALEWLLGQQHADGGWGNPASPYARDLPTLAAVLALHTHGTRAQEMMAVQHGLIFLRRQSHQWATLTDAIPVGIELLLPRLLEEAAAIGLEIAREPYAPLIALGNRRRRLIAAQPVVPGTTPVHSWEAWGSEPDLLLIDGSGGVGHSPAATAAWLRAAHDRPDLADTCATARRYLEQAAAATGLGIPGVVPTAWPITRFEQSNALYALFIAGLYKHPGIQDVIQPQLAVLERSLRPNGLGFSDWFMPDGDDTAEALAVLHLAGRTVTSSAITLFAHDDHFCSYLGELQPSLTTTIHGVHALSLLGVKSPRQLAYISEHQLPDGRWIGDKWNTSWLYSTLQAIHTLSGIDEARQFLPRVLATILAYQYADGGWGFSASNSEDTAYGVLLLRTFARANLLSSDGKQALRAAERWMLEHYRPFHTNTTLLWLAKEAYRPHRIARMIELSATMPMYVEQ